ncbi:MAG: gamma-glutamyl-gamma-aminobutyrate hydrolase family protein [Clostridia bacterium]|nr:gamma-glutamyl-gamma-aminobutyrate hydrolase family protein [Clostridia bacterium]
MLCLILLIVSESDAEAFARVLDGLCISGGADIDPAIYGCDKDETTEVYSDGRFDESDLLLLRAFEKAGKPVFGICRGIQLINAALGGTLYQDLPLQHPSETNHHGQPPYDQPVHDVAVYRDSPLYACLEKETLPVNSYHHQAVKAIAKGLQVMAAAPDGIVEAFYKPDQRFLWAVQWHPEFAYRTDENSRKIFGAFVEAMKRTL